jgi:hypothetical protein
VRRRRCPSSPTATRLARYAGAANRRSWTGRLRVASWRFRIGTSKAEYSASASELILSRYSCTHGSLCTSNKALPSRVSSPACASSCQRVSGMSNPQDPKILTSSDVPDRPGPAIASFTFQHYRFEAPRNSGGHDDGRPMTWILPPPPVSRHPGALQARSKGGFINAGCTGAWPGRLREHVPL